MPAVLPAPVSYVDFDYASLDDRLVKLTQSVFTDLDTDSAAELTRMLLDGNAFIGDVLAFYLRKTGREARWSTATQRKSLISGTKLIGYKPAGATAATAVETFSIASAIGSDVVIPAATFVKTKEVPNPVKFQLLAPVTIPAGQTSVTGTVENSVSASDVLTSTGLASQRLVLGKTPYLDGSAVPVAANGTYTEVDDFLDSGPTDRHFTVRVDQNDRATLQFGDGVNGTIPVGDVVVAYKTGGGTVGRVPAGALSAIEGTFTDAFGTSVRVSVTNAAKADGGTDRETVQQIRLLAPASLRVLTRAVAREDFEIGALKVPGVARALALGLDEDASVGPNEMLVYVVPEQGGTASQNLLDAVSAQFEPVNGSKPPLPKVNSLRLRIFSAQYLTLSLQATVYLRRGVLPATARAAILRRLVAFLAPTIQVADLLDLAPELARTTAAGLGNKEFVQNPLVDFGYYLQDEDGDPTGSFAFSDLYNVVRDTAGVLKMGDGDAFLLNGAPNDVAMQPKQFPLLGTVTLVNGSTGLPL